MKPSQLPPLVSLIIALSSSLLASLVLAGDAGGGLNEPFRVIFDVLTRDERNGSFTLEVMPAWAPLGCERMREMVDHKFFDDTKFFHVVSQFMAHFGIHGDPSTNKRWSEMPIQDDPPGRAVSNKRGTVSFMAAQGKNTRTTHMWINLKDNLGLEKIDLTPFARVVEGMEVVDEINGEYGERPDIYKARDEGKAYLAREFPRLSSIVRARYVQEEEEEEEESRHKRGKNRKISSRSDDNVEL